MDLLQYILLFLAISTPPALSKCQTNPRNKTLVILAVDDHETDLFLKSRRQFNQIGILGDHYYLAHLEIASALNSTIMFKKVSNGWFGTSPGKNGSWNGLVGDLINCRGDITLAMSYTYSRSRVIGYSIPVRLSDVIFITGLDQEINPTEKEDSLEYAAYQPVHIWTTVLMWTSMIVTSLFLFILIKLYPVIINGAMPEITNLKVLSEAGELMVILIKSAYDQPSVARFRTKTATNQIKIILGIWLLSLIVFTSIFKSIWVSFTIIPFSVHLPGNFDQLLKSNYKIYGAELTTTSLQSDIETLNTSVGRAVLNRTMNSEFLKCIEATEAPRTACIGYRQGIELFANEKRTDVFGKPLYQMSKSSILLSTLAAYALQKDSKIKTVVDRVAYRLHESGIYMKWIQDSQLLKSRIGRKQAVKKLAARNVTVDPIKKDVNIRARKHRELMTIMKSMGNFVVIGCITFIGEVLVNWLLPLVQRFIRGQLAINTVLLRNTDNILISLTYCP